MKGKIIPLVFLLLQLFLVNSVKAQLWKNLDFTALPTAAEGWAFLRTPPATGPVTLPDSSIALRITGPFTNDGSGAVYQTIPYQVDRLTRYEVTAQVMTKGTTGRGASLYAYGKIAGKVTGYATAGNIAGDHDWQLLQFTFIADSRMDSIRLGCFLEGEGEAWFKGLTWKQLPLNEEPIAERASGYLDTFFRTVQAEALYRERLDWPALRRDVDVLVAGAEGPDQTHEALNYILRRINPHSFLIPPQAAARWSGTADPEVADQPQQVAVATGYRINNHIAYLSIPHLGTGHGPTKTYFADTLQALIAHLDTRETRGWVIDLRDNDGGNCWPMLAGIGPVLGEGVCGYFMAPDGSNASAWSYRKGVSYQDDYPQTAVSKQPYKLHRKQPKVAVLLGPKTASSGEIMATAFLGRPNTRNFGQPTAGYSTTNRNIYLSDGAIVLLTVSVYADRNKQAIPLKVIPEVIVTEPNDTADAGLAAALQWLQQD